jgi:putative flippase GtrA
VGGDGSNVPQTNQQRADDAHGIAHQGPGATLSGLPLQPHLRALRRSPLGLRVTRYTIGSIVALVVSEIVFGLCYSSGLGTTRCAVLAFVAGALPNWILNRRWAWRRRGRVSLWREVVPYAAISVISLVASSATTGWTNHQIRHRVASAGLRTAAVTATYLVTFAVLFVAKFLLYELVIFAERHGSPPPDAGRSRHQVRSTTRVNRAP